MARSLSTLTTRSIASGAERPVEYLSLNVLDNPAVTFCSARRWREFRRAREMMSFISTGGRVTVNSAQVVPFALE